MAIHLSPFQAFAQEAHHGSTLLDRVGNTPLLRLSRVTRDLAPAVELYAKAEWFNPSGSVKDRPAAAILRQGRETGALSPEKALLDSTSGNMGIAYATLGAALRLRVCLMVPANVTPERLAILRALNAEITLTDPLEGTEGARKAAVEVAAKDPDRYYFADQFSNPANWQAHYHTTGPELAEQTNGRLTHFVAGLGTSGTLMGAGRYLRETIPQARLIAVQPDQPMHGLEGLKHFASSTVPPIFDPSLPDETLGVRTEEAHAMARRLGREEGLLIGVRLALPWWLRCAWPGSWKKASSSLSWPTPVISISASPFGARDDAPPLARSPGPELGARRGAVPGRGSRPVVGHPRRRHAASDHDPAAGQCL